jgi:hypothetical protein
VVGCSSVNTYFRFRFLRGCRLALVARMGNDEKEILPDAYVGTFFIKGCVLWFMTVFYMIIPTIIIFSFGAGEIGNLFATLGCFWTSMFGSETDPSLYMCLKAEASEMMLRITIEIVWLMVAGSLYRVATNCVDTHCNSIKYPKSFEHIYNGVLLNSCYIIHHLSHFDYQAHQTWPPWLGCAALVF